jgi:hypothetical protein
VNVAWITHRKWEPVGGAEMCDIDMAMRRPENVKLTVMWPGGIGDDLPDFDHVIVSGWYGFSSRELNRIQDVAHKTTIWAHDSQMNGHWLYSVCHNLVFSSKQHMAHDLEGMEYKGRTFVNPGWMDMDEIYSIMGGDRDGALWAHRPIPHKGLDLAAEWALENDVRLDVLVGRPRKEVLEAMASHKYFVLLSHIFDSGPRSVMEAQLLGCELVINDNVGWFNESPAELASRLHTADKQFWEVVIS